MKLASAIWRAVVWLTPRRLRLLIPCYAVLATVVWSVCEAEPRDRLETIRSIMFWPRALHALRLAGGLRAACKTVIGPDTLPDTVRAHWSTPTYPDPDANTVAGLFLTLASFTGALPPDLKE